MSSRRLLFSWSLCAAAICCVVAWAFAVGALPWVDDHAQCVTVALVLYTALCLARLARFSLVTRTPNDASAARPLSTEPPDVVEETEYTRHQQVHATTQHDSVDLTCLPTATLDACPTGAAIARTSSIPAPPRPPPLCRVPVYVNPFGGDAYVDTVPRGALLICDPLAAPETAAKWRALKASVIDRFGGALSFALLCKTHPNSIDRKRWPCSDSESLGTVAIDDIGSHVHSQVVKHVGRWTAHGYAIVFCAKQKTTFEGLWERGTMTHGYFRGWSPSSQTFAWLRRPGGKVFGCLWHMTAPNGKSRSHICHYVPASHRDRFARRGPLQYNIDTMPPLCKPDAADGIVSVVITRLKIASNNGAWGFNTDIIIEGCEWTVIEPVEDAVYQGRVLYPADPRSRQFDQMAEYVLLGCSEQAFGPDQQAAFVAAICAIIATRDGAL